MITVITGTPGAGKTLYAIEKLLLPLVGTHVPQTVDGVTTLHPRTIFTNIKGLLIDHELIQADTDEGLRNWQNWAKPGSVLVIDEFQRWWPPRANGSKIPDDISALDTHRHMGVDFILITQNVMNADRHIHGLTGRHLHIRRMANMHLGIVYEWDHCSKTLMYSKSLTKQPWRYSKKVFKLYHSADLHTKQKRSVPTLVWFLLLAVVAGAYLGPTTYQRLKERVSPPPAKVSGVTSTTTTTTVPGNAIPRGQVDQVNGASSSTTTSSSSSSSSSTAAGDPQDRFAGCARLLNVCRCYTASAQVIEKPAQFCQAQTSPAVVDHAAPRSRASYDPFSPRPPELLKHVPDLAPLPTTDPRDIELASFARSRLAVVQ